MLDYYVSHAWSEGFAHQFAGLVMLDIALKRNARIPPLRE